MMMELFSLHDLPVEIYLALREYLPSDDYFCLLNTSKAVFGQVKRDHAYYSLNTVASLRFLQNGFIRAKMLKKVKDPCKQIAVKINKQDFSKFKKWDTFTVHKVNAYHATSFVMRAYGSGPCEWSTWFTIPPLPHITSFECTDFLKDIRNAAHLKSLSCRIKSSAFPQLAQLTALEEMSITVTDWKRNIRYVSDKNETYVSELDCSVLRVPNTKLKVEKFPELTCLYNLNNVQKLQLIGCKLLSDISSLRGIRDLELKVCPLVEDILGLGGHHRLFISRCGQTITGYEILRDIPIVGLEGCDIRDVSVLQDCKEVQLLICKEVRDVSPLRKVRRVVLSGCGRITDISSLAVVPELTTSALPLNVPITTMNAGCTLTVDIQYESKELTQTILFPAVHKLTVYRSENPTLLTSLSYLFPSLQFLKLERIKIHFHLNGLETIHTVILEFCSELSSIEGLGRNRCVKIIDCPRLKDVSCLERVPIVTIIGCPKLKVKETLAELQAVQRLVFKREMDK